MKKKLFILFIVLSLVAPKISNAIVTSSSISNDLKIYLYYIENCDKCEEEKRLLESLTSEFPRISLEYLNINSLPEQVVKTFKINTNKLPITIIGSTIFSDFNEKIEKELKEALQNYNNAESFCNVMTKLENEKDIKICIEENNKIYQKHSKSIFGLSIAGILILVIATSALFKLIKKN